MMCTPSRKGKSIPDDVSPGHVYPKEEKYTKSQLLSFARHICRLQFEFTEEANATEKQNS
jgi:hypothetical protein